MFPTEPRPTQEDKVYPELPVSNLAPKRKSSPLARILLIVVVVVLVAGAVLFALTQHRSKQTPKPAQTQSAKSTNDTSHVTSIDSSTKRYDSTNLSIGFDYPSDWSVSDTGGGKLSVISPMLELKASSGQTIKARIVMSVRGQQPSISQFAANTAVAPIASQKITYKQPTPSQRAKTYLTFVNYTGSSKTIDAMYITGDNGYAADQYIPQSDITKDDPLVSIGFFSCSDVGCNNYGSAVGIATSSWSDPDLSKPLINLLQSLVIG